MQRLKSKRNTVLIKILYIILIAISCGIVIFSDGYVPFIVFSLTCLSYTLKDIYVKRRKDEEELDVRLKEDFLNASKW